MTDLDAALDLAEQPHSPACKYGRILADVTDEQRARLEGLTAATASRALAAADLPVSADVIRRHRVDGHRCG